MKTAGILVIVVLAFSASAFHLPSFTSENDEPARCCECRAKIIQGTDKTKIGVLSPKKGYVDVFGNLGDCPASLTGYKYE